MLCAHVLDDGGECVDWVCILGMGLEGQGWVE